MTNLKLLTVAEAAQLKGVTRSAVYAAMRDGRLPHLQILGRFGVRETDVVAWVPAPHSGRRKGTKLSDEAKMRISQGQRKRWAKKKGQD